LDEETKESVSMLMDAPAAAGEKSTSFDEESEPQPHQQVQAITQKFQSSAVAAPAPAESFPPFTDLPADVRSGLPEMNLQLHFYSPEPARRLVRLNGFNLREGEKGGDGLNVVEITSDGIRLACRGTRFFFPAARR
jgi:general secretion pathway protein B